MTRDDLPDDIVNADPPGSWEGGDFADEETIERNAQAATPTAPAIPPDEDGANQGADPDLTADADA
jgi:hypothetical protein